MAYQLNQPDITDALNDSFINNCHNVFYETFSQPEVIQATATRLVLPSQFGRGEFAVRKLENTTLSSINVHFHNDTCLIETAQENIFFITISPGAEMAFNVMDQNASNIFPAKTLSLGYSHYGEIYRTEISKKENIHTLSFFFTKVRLQDYLREFDRPDLIEQLENANRMQIFEQAALSANQQYLISRLSNNPYQGLLEKLYFESVAGELLISLLESLCRHQSVEINLTNRDRELLKYARKLLLKDPQNPPTIAQLAKSVGLNEDKLKKGFKALFDNTIFKTLTEHRMQQALKQVSKNDMSITEIAYDSGYENVSNFIAVFRKTFGKTPGMMRKEVQYFLSRKSG